eukprot:535053-Amphidinium_carterae.1
MSAPNLLACGSNCGSSLGAPKRRRSDDIDAIAASFAPNLIMSEPLFKRFLWKALLAIMAATRKLDKPWERIKEVVPSPQHKAAWEAVLTAVIFPNK